MGKQYVLIKLPLETVRNLRKRQTQLGKPSINDLLIDMIRVFDDRNATLKCTGWRDAGGVLGD